MEEDLKWPPRLPGCGTQHPLRALGGTCVLLAAAPTTPPCFRRWRRSSSLLAIFSGRNILNFGVQESLRTFLNPFFTGGVVKANGSCRACFLRKQSRGGVTPSVIAYGDATFPKGTANPLRRSRASSPEGRAKP